jgi:hypothetical protein
VIAAAAVAALALATSTPDAPLGVRTQGTFRELFLDPVLWDARPASRAALDLRWSFANDWSTPTLVRRGADLAALQADEQADSLTLSARAPWGRATLGAEWRLTQHWGGWSDPVIETWHRVLHVYNYERLAYPRNAVTVRLGAASGPRAIELTSPRLAWGDVVLRAQLPLLGGGGAGEGGRERWTVALRGDLKVPTGRVGDAGGSGGWDGAAALAASAELSPRLTVHAMTSASVVSDLPRAAVVQPRRWQLGADLSLALRLGAWTVLAEDRLRSALLEGGWRYEGKREPRRGSAFMGAFRPQNQVSLGVRRGPFTAWFSEDFTLGGGDPAQGFYYLSNAPDFALGVAFAHEL